jgi:hypothetical protein
MNGSSTRTRIRCAMLRHAQMPKGSRRAPNVYRRVHSRPRHTALRVGFVFLIVKICAPSSPSSFIVRGSRLIHLVSHPARTSISRAVSVTDRFSLRIVKSSKPARSRITSSSATRATYWACHIPDSRILTRDCATSTLAARRQITTILAATHARHRSNSVRLSTARDNKTRVTPAAVEFSQRRRRLRYIQPSRSTSAGKHARPKASRSNAT